MAATIIGQSQALTVVEDAVTVQSHDALAGQVTFQVADLSATITLTFEGTVNGSDWVAIFATNLATDARTLTTTADGLFRVDASALQLVRCRASTVSGGSANVAPWWVIG